jgi:exopolysaccharide production protein ExoQ
MNKLLIWTEKVFTVISLIHYSGGPLLVILSNGVSEGEEGDDATFALINIIFSVIYIITFCLLLLRWKKVVTVIASNRLVWLLIGLAISSIFWSASPDLTKTRIVALIGTTMLSLYLASRYSLKEQLQLLGWTFGTIIIFSIIFSIILPKYGQMSGVHVGAWRGIYNHKNVLGKMMVFSSIVFSLLALKAQKQRWAMLGLLGMSVTLIIFSRASAPLLNLFIIWIALFALHILRWNYLFMIPALIGIASVGIVIYTVLSTNAAQVVGAFGKDLTLTGRTNFWPLILDKIWENPVLGYGFGAFWRGLEGPSAYIWNSSTFKSPNAHNGYLDLCLDLGLVGLSIYLIKFITSFQKSLAYVRLVNTPDGFWPTLLFCYIILANLTETSLMMQNNLLWVMQVSTFLSLYESPLSPNKDPVLKET